MTAEIVVTEEDGIDCPDEPSGKKNGPDAADVRGDDACAARSRGERYDPPRNLGGGPALLWGR